MATKARHLKTPLQLWIADNRKRLGLTPADLAQLTGVTTDTARGWESRGRPSEDALGILERRFGVAVPRGSEPEGGLSELVAAIRAQTAAMTDLIEELRLARQEPAALRAAVEETQDFAGDSERQPQADPGTRGARASEDPPQAGVPAGHP